MRERVLLHSRKQRLQCRGNPAGFGDANPHTPGRGIGAHWATPCMSMGIFCHRERLSSIAGHSSGESHTERQTPQLEISS